MKQAKAAAAPGTGIASPESAARKAGARSSTVKSAPDNSVGERVKGALATVTGNGRQDAIELLKEDHRDVEDLFDRYEGADDNSEKADLARQICTALIIHTKLEEELFYPACRAKGVEDKSLDEAQVEHDGAKVMVAELLKGHPGEAFFDAKVKVLSEYIKHHVAEEEKMRTGIFAKARKAGVEIDQLGERLRARKDQLTAQKETLSKSPLEARALQHLQDVHANQENMQMARYSNQGNGGRNPYDRDGDFNRNRMHTRKEMEGDAGSQPRHLSSYESGRHDYPHDPITGRRYGQDDQPRHMGGDQDHGGRFGRDHEDRGYQRQNRDQNAHEGWYGSERDSARWGSDRDMSGSHGPYDRPHSGQYSQSNDGQGAQGQGAQGQGAQGQGGYGQGSYGQGNYGQGNYGQGSEGGYSESNFGRHDQDRISRSGQGGQYSQGSQYGHDDEARWQGASRSQQSQGGYASRSQQMSQNRFGRDYEERDPSAMNSRGRNSWQNNDHYAQNHRSDRNRHDHD